MDVRKIISEKGLKQWAIAEQMGISEFTLSRWLRRPEKLTNVQRQRLENAIDNLISNKGA